MRTYNADFLKRTDLEALGVVCGGDDVRVHTSVVIVCPERLELGDHVRIDPFCVLTAEGGIKLGSYIHVGAHCSLIGGGGIVIEDFATLSHGVRIFSVGDDSSGESLINPTLPALLRGATKAPVILKRHSGLGAGVVIMPGVTVREGALVSPLTFVRHSLSEWSIWASPAPRVVQKRKKNVLALEQKLAQPPPPV